jgi:PKD repeat protein
MQPLLRRGPPGSGTFRSIQLALVLAVPLLLIVTLPGGLPHAGDTTPGAPRPGAAAPAPLSVAPEAVRESPRSVPTPAAPDPSGITIIKLGAKPTSGTLPLTVAFNATVNSSQDKAAKFTFVWKYNDSTPLTWVNVSGAAGVPVVAFSNHTFDRVGFFDVRVNVTDNLGDAAVLSHLTNISVSPAPITLTDVTANRTGGAIPFSTQLTATAKSAQDRAATFTFDWFFDDGTPNETDVRTAAAGASAVSFFNHTYAAIGTYDARVNVTDNLTGDTYALSHLVAILTTAPLLTWANASRKQFTLGGSVELVTAIAGGLGPYRVSWSATPPGCSAGALDLNCTPTLAGTFTLRVSVQDAVGNKNVSNVSFTVFPSIILVAHYSSYFACQGSIGVLDANFTAAGTYGTSPLNYTWTFGDGSPSANGWNVTHQFDTTGNYTVISWVNDSGGGTANYTLVVPASFSSCGTVPPPSFGPSVRVLEVGAGVLVILIVLLAVLIVRTPRKPPAPTPMVPASTSMAPASMGTYSEGPPTDEVAPPAEAPPAPVSQ